METTIEEKLNSLNALQAIDSKIDALKATRGELPIEVQDLEDELAGLETRIERYKEEITGFESDISNAKNKSKDKNTSILAIGDYKVKCLHSTNKIYFIFNLL